MKSYPSPLDALLAHLHYLKAQGTFNSNALAKMMDQADIPENDKISSSMWRMLANGDTDRIVERRVMAACKLLDIHVTAVAPHPADFKPTKR